MKSGKVPVFLLLALMLLFCTLPAVAQISEVPQGLPAILEFDRKFCPVCAKSETVIKAVKSQFPGRFTVRKIYIDEEQYLFRRYKVAIVPTQIFLNPSGQEVSRHEGPYNSPESFIQKLRELHFIV